MSAIPTKRFSTALRDVVRHKMEELGEVDFLIGIPSYGSDTSISHVISTIYKGLDTYFHNSRALIMISDGGSTDDTRDIARAVDIGSFNIEKIVAIYRGVPGKGSALRAIFEAGKFLKPKAVAVFDSDLVSISPVWIKNLMEPVLDGYDFVAPDYNRYKLDATITNTIAYHLTRALYGYRVRQPIGGDFGLSLPLIRHYLEQDVWESDVARFGIDIWMTVTAIVDGFKICQSKLGVKVHGAKDPVADLGPMFRQVMGTLFQLMEATSAFWKDVKGSRDIPTFGNYTEGTPVAFEINREGLIEYFQVGFRNFGSVWQQIIEEDDFKVIQNLVECTEIKDFHLPIAVWIRIVYRYANAVHSTPRQRMKLLDTLTPLYYARVASLVNELEGMESQQLGDFFSGQAKVFEDMKDYLINLWT
ncbi:MAG: glycosyltransferase [Syntrophaceae bacterium]|nr:glycosyltransferase [Syntrophaceae bacterium]